MIRSPQGTFGNAALRIGVYAATAFALSAIVACGPKAPEGPTREALVELLRQEAQKMKTEGERLDPKLGVTATWHIAAVDVVERKGDADRPWDGTVRFRIETRSRDVTGDVTDRMEKRFEYSYSTALQKWHLR